MGSAAFFIISGHDKQEQKVFPCLQDNYNYTSAKPNEQKAIEWYRENLEINLDSNEAACFTKIFSFRKGLATFL